MNEEPNYLVLFLFLVMVVLVGAVMADTFHEIYVTHGNVYYKPNHLM